MDHIHLNAGKKSSAEDGLLINYLWGGVRGDVSEDESAPFNDGSHFAARTIDLHLGGTVKCFLDHIDIRSQLLYLTYKTC